MIEGTFFNPTKGNLTSEQVIAEMIEYMSLKPDMFYDIIVGCDSSSVDMPNFPVVVAILRVGEGGRFFLKNVTYSPQICKKFANWKNRIIEEVLLSCELAVLFKKDFTQRIPANLKYQFEYIHADIGEKGQTKDMVKELTGLIRGNGFEPKIKPESYIASVVADRFS